MNQSFGFGFQGNSGGGGSTLPYKSYVVRLNGSNGTVNTIFENTTGSTLAWSKIATGHYEATRLGGFDDTKTYINCQSYGAGLSNASCASGVVDFNGLSYVIGIYTGDGTAPFDALDVFVEIRIYN
jgi:hypothetical protein